MSEMGLPIDVSLDLDVGERHHVIVRVAGELDLSSATLLHEVLVGQVVMHDFVTVDLSDVTFMDSAGLWALVDASHVRRGALRIGRCSPEVERLLDITETTYEFAHAG